MIIISSAELSQDLAAGVALSRSCKRRTISSASGGQRRHITAVGQCAPRKNSKKVRAFPYRMRTYVTVRYVTLPYLTLPYLTYLLHTVIIDIVAVLVREIIFRLP